MIKKINRKIIKRCPVCNKQLILVPSLAKRRIYCSYRCYWESLKGKRSPLDKRLKKKCPVCNKEFLTKISINQKYCSQNCYAKDKKGKMPWNKGIHMWENKEHPRGTLGKTSKFKDKTFDEIYGKEKSEKLKSKLRENILKQYNSGKFPRQINTDIEQKLKEELIKRGYIEYKDFIHQFPFRNEKGQFIFLCDFCFPSQKLIVECNGDWHHANPKIYQNKKLHPIQKKMIIKDRNKDRYMRTIDNGTWRLLVIWGSEIKKDVSNCADKIEKLWKK